MSFDKQIAELTDAIYKLTDAFIAHTNDVKPSSAKETKAPMADKAPVSAKVPEKAPAAKKPVVKAGDVEKALAAEEAAAETIPYSDIQTLIKKNVATKRSQITKVLAKYGIDTATALLPEQYKAFYDALIEEGLEAVTADLA